MESVKAKLSPLMPFLLLGYLETLRIAAFNAFEQENSKSFFLTALLVIAYSVILHFKMPRKAKILSGLIILSLILLNGIVSSGYDKHSMVIIIAANTAYGLIILMISGFILERSSGREIFLLGGFLLAAIWITSTGVIWPLVALNFIFGVGLAGQLHLMSLENDPRARFPKGTGIKIGIWGSVFLVIVMFISLLNVLFPVKDSRVSGISSVFHIFRNTGKQSDAAFWDKLQKFEFKGTVPLDDSVVMMVQSSRPSYWKGESFDFYTGRGWANTMSVRTAREGDFANPFPPDTFVSKVIQKFNFSPSAGSQVIFFGGVPAQVEISNGFSLSSGDKIITDNGGNFYIPGRQTGLSYDVVSYFAEFSPSQSLNGREPYPANIEPYLQLPELPERVRILAQQITESSPKPYEKARKIERYLSANYPYDLTVKPAPANRDITDYFLFDLKRGYCTYHSTAMVVMLRAAGIPARWVTGFTTGNYSAEKGSYEVKMSNAHAWVEAYIAGFGWVPLEPTSSFKLPVIQKNTSPVNSIKQLESGIQGGEAAKLDDRKPYVKIILVALVTVSLIAIIILRRKPFSFSNTQNMEQVYKLFLQLLARKGHHKNVVQTPLEFANQLVAMEELNEDYADIMYITESYVQQRFGPGQTDACRLDESKNALKRLARKWSIKTRD